jgi:hypothetical protein
LCCLFSLIMAGSVRELYPLETNRSGLPLAPRKTRARFLESCRHLRSLHPPEIKIAIICDTVAPHLTTRKDKRAGQWATATTPSSPTRRRTPR